MICAGTLLALANTVQIWHTDNDTHSFVHIASTNISSEGTIELTVLPESIYTVTTTVGQSRGSFPHQPAASAPFPAAWAGDFDSGVIESVPKYWADQAGSFQIASSGGGRSGKSVIQRVAMRMGKKKWHGELLNPLIILGAASGPSLATTFSVDARVPLDAFPQPPLPPPPPPPKWRPSPLQPPSGAWVGLCDRVSSVGHNQNMVGVYRGVCLQVNATTAAGRMGWRVETDGTDIVASGELQGSTLPESLSKWHTLEHYSEINKPMKTRSSNNQENDNNNKSICILDARF